MENVNYYDSEAYEASAVIMTAPGTVYSITGFNSGTGSLFVQLHDAASLPIDTAVPKIILAVPANSNFFYDFSEFGRFCQKGIVICGSTTGPIKTISGAVLWFNIQYA